jgi:hypothetical protein
MTPVIVVALMPLCLCAPSVLAKQSKCDATLQRIDALLKIYEKEHPLKHYPSTLKEFHNLVTKKGQVVDLSVFSEFSCKHRGPSLQMSYTCKDTGQSAAKVRAHITTY